MKDYPVREIKLVAGEQNGQPVIETIEVTEPRKGEYLLLKSPCFIRGLARGDLISFDEQSGIHTVLKRSGHLCIRVFARADIEALAGEVTPALEKLGGALDFANERMLVFSIHVSCGFKAIEDVLNQSVGHRQDAMWMYGNVYKMEDGEPVPMNWWQDMLKPE